MNSIESKHNINADNLNVHLESHLINVDAIRNDIFNEFIVSRASNILDLIEEATGKAVNGRNSEETIQSFGKAL